MPENETHTNIDALEAIVKILKLGPPDNRLWAASDVASYLNCSVSTVANKYLPRRDFPCAIRLGKIGYPRYEAKEVKKWARSFKERRAT
ncbi:MAG: hypothetical protein JKY60_20310 [Kordiimonadaceae bacterium]|nr:hypothetical protein [Kordiimonadaceae bacterium]